MRNLFCLFSIVWLFQSASFANDITIFEIRRNIPLSDEEPVYKDYYINAGEADGLKLNMVVNVNRLIMFKDVKAQGNVELLVPVGQLRIIYTQGRLAVARMYQLPTREAMPMLEQPSFLIGDRVELKGSFVEKKPIEKQVVRKPTSETDTSQVVRFDETESAQDKHLPPAEPTTPASAKTSSVTSNMPPTIKPEALDKLPEVADASLQPETPVESKTE